MSQRADIRGPSVLGQCDASRSGALRRPGRESGVRRSRHGRAKHERDGRMHARPRRSRLHIVWARSASGPDGLSPTEEALRDHAKLRAADLDASRVASRSDHRAPTIGAGSSKEAIWNYLLGKVLPSDGRRENVARRARGELSRPTGWCGQLAISSSILARLGMCIGLIEEDCNLLIRLASDVHSAMHPIGRFVPVSHPRLDGKILVRAAVAILDRECVPAEYDGHAVVGIAMPRRALAWSHALPAHEDRSSFE